MNLSKTLLRTALAGVLLSSGAALAAPGDFTADLGVTVSFVTKTGETAGVTDNTVALNGTRQVKIHLTSLPGQLVQGITLTAPTPTGGLSVSAVTNCTPTGSTRFPCTVANLQDGATKDVVVTLRQSLPTDISTLPSTCGNAPVYGDFTVTATTTSTDPDPANNGGTVTPVSVPWVYADLEVSFTGPAEVAEGSNATYHVTVTNHGPCTSTDVWAFSDAYGSAPFVSATWDAICQNTGDDFEADGCQLGDMLAGDVIEFDKVYNVPNMSSDAISLYHPNGVALDWTTTDYDHNLDPDGNPLYPNSSDMLTYVTQSVGCSTAGAGAPTGLLALGAVIGLVLRRRRS